MSQCNWCAREAAGTVDVGGPAIDLCERHLKQVNKAVSRLAAKAAEKNDEKHAARERAREILAQAKLQHDAELAAAGITPRHRRTKAELEAAAAAPAPEQPHVPAKRGRKAA